MWSEYLIFILEVFTIVLAIILVMAAITAIKAHNKSVSGTIEVKSISKKY